MRNHHHGRAPAHLIRFGTPLAGVVATLPSSLHARNHPAKPVRMVVPFAPGGTTDILARLVGQRLAEPFGHPVVIDSRPGAHGALDTEMVGKSPPDRYAIVMEYPGSLAVNPHPYPKLTYDPIRDFAPITNVSVATQALVSHPSLPVHTVRDLIALGKRQPAQISYASAGIGAPSHLASELLTTNCPPAVLPVVFI